MTVPLYSRGDVCLSGSSLTYNGADIEAGRNLNFSGSSIAIGTSHQPISKVNVVGSCVWSPCDSAHGLWVAPPGLGHTLDVPISAEGVESEQIRAALEKFGCSEAQGWLFGRAVSGDAVRTFLRMSEAGVGPEEGQAAAVPGKARRSR